MPVLKASRLYHMTEAPNWPLIQQYGLLSTSRLLDRAGVVGAPRDELERQQRRRNVVLPNGAIIRDQVPLPAKALARGLTNGLTPADWYAELNRRVFFWIDVARLNRQRRAGGSSPQIVLVIDAAKLLARYRTKAEVTPFNTGNARRKPAVRSRETFLSYAEWLTTGWSSEARATGSPIRPMSTQPVELAIPDSVVDVLDFVIAWQHLRPGEELAAATAILTGAA